MNHVSSDYLEISDFSFQEKGLQLWSLGGSERNKMSFSPLSKEYVSALFSIQESE